MPDAGQIRLNQLLLEREAQFVRIYDVEQAAARILGEPYPFTRPALPSDQRRKAKSTPRGGTSPARETLRRLEDGEAAYRVTYRHFEREFIEEHDDLDALRALVGAQGARLSVLRVETLGPEGSVKATLIPRASS
jgi:hypothetical protein